LSIGRGIDDPADELEELSRAGSCRESSQP
jgi:hypothetical protein